LIDLDRNSSSSSSSSSTASNNFFIKNSFLSSLSDTAKEQKIKSSFCLFYIKLVHVFA